MACAIQILRDFLAERRDALHRTVAVLPFVECQFRGIQNRGGGMKIRFTQFEMDDGTAFALQLFGARKNRQRTFAAHHRHS